MLAATLTRYVELHSSFCSYSTVTVYFAAVEKHNGPYSRTCTDQPSPVLAPFENLRCGIKKGPMREVPSFLNRQATSLNRRYVRLNRDRPRGF